MVDKAAEMAKDLLVVVREEWAKAQAAQTQGYQQQQGYQQGYQQQQPMYMGFQGQPGYQVRPFSAPHTRDVRSSPT